MGNFNINRLDKLFLRIKNSPKKIQLFTSIYYTLSKLKYKAVANPFGVILVNPHEITHNVNTYKSTRFSLTRGLIKNGDWDKDIKLFENKKKHKSLLEHFKEGKAWLDTVKFKKHYKARFERGEVVRGCADIYELATFYEKSIDGLYHSIKADGFKMPGREVKQSDMLVFIDRKGQILLGPNGNHRLTIAKLLNLAKIPVKVHVRHENWQKTREKVYRSLKENKGIDSDYLKFHPDLQDLFCKF